MSSSASCIEPNFPVPCILYEIGNCPEEPLDESTSSATSSGSTSETTSECGHPYRGMRDRPRPWYGVDTANFTMGGIVQYFWVPPSKLPIRKHSHLAFTWDPVGHFKYVELDNNKIPRTILWDKDKPVEQADQSSSSGSFCYVENSDRDDPSEISGLELHQKANCIVRVMALRGGYGCMNPCAGSSIASSIVSECPSSGPNSTRTIPIVFPEEELLCDGLNAITPVDPTMTNRLSELAMEIDPAGHLARVYWGGRNECDDNPCVWNRDDPPPGMANVVVPVIQSSFRYGPLDEASFDVWLLHFDPIGHYMYASAYMRICSCPPTCSHRWCESSDMPQPFCVCRDLCLITEGCEGLASSPATCPATVSIPCELALIEQCISAISSPGNCNYIWTLECCPLPVLDPDILVSSLADASDVINRGCLYSGDSAPRTCETHRSEI